MSDMKKTWKLDDIIRLDQLDKVAEKIRRDSKQFAKYFAKMSPDMTTEDFLAYLAFSEQIQIDLSRLYGRATDMEAVDQKSAQARQLKETAKDLDVLVSEASRKIGLWLKGKLVDDKPVLDDKNAKRLFSASGELEYALSYMRAGERYSLGEREENIISQKDANGVAVLTDLREVIEAEQEYKFAPPGRKAQKISTNAEMMSYVYSSDPAEREEAYRGLYAQYAKNTDKYFMIYQAVVKDWAGEAKLRGYTSSIAMRNRANHVPDRAIEVLMEVCAQNIGLYQRFFRWKAGALGLDQLRRFDIYAPLVQTSSKLSYNEAEALVLDVFAQFSSTFAGFARQIVEADHIDSHPSAHKRGGAYCQTIAPQIVPFVLLNYTGKLRDVSTIAHELGHGVHSLYSAHLPAPVQHASLPLAETASTLGEMILFERLLGNLSDPAERRKLLADKMADSYATIIRQNYFVKFELMAHERLMQGASADELGQLWLDTLHEQFGDAVAVDPVFAHEWSYIPHIVHTPFYCYAYNFGELLSLALYARYKAEGEAFVPKIEQILRAGGSVDPVKLLDSIGIDMCSADFWQGSFSVVEGWIDQLEAVQE